MSRWPLDACPWPGHCLTDAWAARHRQLGTDTLLDAMTHGWAFAEARVEQEEARLLRQAGTPGERLAVQQFFAWVRQDHVTRQ